MRWSNARLCCPTPWGASRRGPSTDSTWAASSTSWTGAPAIAVVRCCCASLAGALRCCREVYNLGAPTLLEPGSTDIIRQGTVNVLQACLGAGVDRVVYTSSIVTVGYSSDPAVVLDELSNERT